MTKIVIFTGRAGSGKSTAAKHLERNGYKLIKFASPLKNMLRTLGLTEEEIEGTLKEKPSKLLCGKSPRHAMQTLGTEWGRGLIGEDIWVNAWQAAVEDALSQGYSVVTDDCRFDNEMERAKLVGGRVFQIVRPHNPHEISASHASESVPNFYDCLINNSGTMEQLFDYLDFAIPREMQYESIS